MVCYHAAITLSHSHSFLWRFNHSFGEMTFHNIYIYIYIYVRIWDISNIILFEDQQHGTQCYEYLSCFISYFNQVIGLVSRMFANGPGDRGSVPGWVIPKTQKWYLMPPCLALTIIMWGTRIKWSNPGNGVVPSPTHQCISYWKGSLWVTLD